MTVLEADSTVEDVSTGGLADTGEDGIEQAESLPVEPMEDVSGTEASDIEARMDQRYGSRSGHYNLRPRWERNMNRWSDAVLTCHGTSDRSVGSVVHTQHNIHQGLKLFGKAGEDAITTELRQLHLRQVLEPMHCHALTDREKKRCIALSHVFEEETHRSDKRQRVC